MGSPGENRDGEPSLTTALRLKVAQEHNRAWDARRAGRVLAPPSGEDIQPPVSDEDYKAEWYTSMAYQTGSSVMDVMKNLNLALSDELLPGPNDFYKFVETLFIPGNTCCVAALPFSNGSLGPDDLDDQSWQNFLASGDFLKILHVQKETVTDPENPQRIFHKGSTDFFEPDIKGFFYDLLSETLRKDVSQGGCSFTIQYPGKMGSHENKVYLSSMIKQAFTNLKKFLLTPPVVKKGKPTLN